MYLIFNISKNTSIDHRRPIVLINFCFKDQCTGTIAPFRLLISPHEKGKVEFVKDCIALFYLFISYLCDIESHIPGLLIAQPG